MSKSNIWRETRNEKFQVTSADSFLADPDVPDGIKASYQEYIQKTNVLNLDKNDKGFYKFDWLEDDPVAGKRYQPTYKDPYGWGAMRGPIPATKKTDTAQQKLETKTEEKSPLTIAKSAPKLETSLGEIAREVTNIRKLIEILAEKKVSELIKPANEMREDEIEEQEASE